MFNKVLIAAALAGLAAQTAFAEMDRTSLRASIMAKTTDCGKGPFNVQQCADNEVCVGTTFPKCITNNGGPLCGETSMNPTSCKPDEVCAGTPFPKCITNNGGPLCGDKSMSPSSCKPDEACLGTTFPSCHPAGSTECGMTICDGSQTCETVPGGKNKACKGGPDYVACGNSMWCHSASECHEMQGGNVHVCGSDTTIGDITDNNASGDSTDNNIVFDN